jgi:hypothetical protein
MQDGAIQADPRSRRRHDREARLDAQEQGGIAVPGDVEVGHEHVRAGLRRERRRYVHRQGRGSHTTFGPHEREHLPALCRRYLLVDQPIDGRVQVRRGHRRGNRLGHAGAHRVEHDGRIEGRDDDHDARSGVPPLEDGQFRRKSSAAAQVHDQHVGWRGPELTARQQLVWIKGCDAQTGAARERAELPIGRFHDGHTDVHVTPFRTTESKRSPGGTRTARR